MKSLFTGLSKDQRLYNLSSKQIGSQAKSKYIHSRTFSFQQQRNFNTLVKRQNDKRLRNIIQILAIGGVSSFSLYNLFSNMISEAENQEVQVKQEFKSRFRTKIIEKDIKSDPSQSTLYVLFDSQNPLHNEFIKEIKQKQIFDRILSKIYHFEISFIDQKSEDSSTFHKFLEFSNTSKQKIQRKKNPTFVLRLDDRVIRLDPNLLNEDFSKSFNKKISKETTSISISSIKELADHLKEFNTDLNDTTFVYFNDPSTQSEESTKVSFRLIRQETRSPILIIHDQELAQQMKMEKGKFYAYFKPSFINGFEQYLDKDINFNYLQAYEGTCRDEFKLNSDYVNSEEFKKQLEETNGLFTEHFTTQIFDNCFSRSFNVEFVFNTNMKEFGKKFKYGQNAEKPIIFVYSPPMYMSRYIGEFKEVLKNYKEVFEFYYSGNEKEAQRYFYTKEFPEIIPYVVIIDPKKRKALKSEAGLQNLSLANNNFYFQKYRELIFFNNIQRDLNKLIDKFLDGECHHFYQSEKMIQDSKVRKICSQNFEEVVVKDKKVKQCIIEIFKHDCPSCAFNGKVFNVFSRKLAKHGYLDRLQCFRLSIDNKVPYLGNFGYSPIYLFVKKEGDTIVEIKTIDAPQKSEQFLEQVEEYSKIKGLRRNIKIKPRDQVLKHIKLQDRDQDFDIDFDTKEEMEVTQK